MRVLLVGGTSSLSHYLRPVLSGFAEVITGGRSDCDIPLDLAGEVYVPSGFDVVVNTAAVHGSRISELTMAENVNVFGLLRLGNACIAAGVSQLVHVSSIFATLRSSSPFNSAYAQTKRRGDEALRDLTRKASLPLTIVRPSQFYGVGERFRSSQPFLFSLMDKAEAGQDIEIWGQRDARRNYIHAQDVADMIARLVQTRTSGVFACTYPKDLSFSEIARAAVDAFGSSSAIRFLLNKPDTADNIFPFDDALYRALGQTPRITIERGIQMEADHRRNHV